MLMIDLILTGIIFGFASFLWCRVLTIPGMAGNFVPVWYWRIMGDHKKWKENFAKPLFDCPVCNSFWVSIFALLYMVVLEAATVSALEGFGVVVAALFTAFALDQKYGE